MCLPLIHVQLVYILALAAKGFQKGEKFLAPVLTFVSTIECGEYLGMSPVLVDCKKWISY